MRLALVSDIHGNLPALEAVVADIRRRGVDAVINLGDSLSGPLLPRETARYLMATDWLHLAGNHERQVLTGRPEDWEFSDTYAHAQLTATEFNWMATLEPRADYAEDILLCHGTPASDIRYFLETVEPTHVRVATLMEIRDRLGGVTAKLVACGHTHTPRAIRLPSGQFIVNPGSVGLQAYDDSRPYPHVIEMGSPDARYAVVERVGATWQAELIAVPYAHESMAELAALRGSMDWAQALRTGYAR